jgi:hypothetical protein
MSTIQLNQIQTKIDKDGSTFFEVWIEYPYDLLETLNKGKNQLYQCILMILMSYELKLIKHMLLNV